MRTYMSHIKGFFALLLIAAVGGFALPHMPATAEGQVEAPVNTVVKATYAVMQDAGLRITGVDFDDEDREYEIEGRRGDTEVDVTLEREGPRFTEIEVSVDSDDDFFDDIFDDDDTEEAYERTILQRIIDRSS